MVSLICNGAMWGKIAGYTAMAILFIFIVVAVVVATERKRKEREGTPESAAHPAKKEIKSVKILGTRTGEETRVFATYNFTIFSLLVKYTDGSKEVIDCKSGSTEFEKYLPYLDNDKPTEVREGDIEMFDNIDD